MESKITRYFGFDENGNRVFADCCCIEELEETIKAKEQAIAEAMDVIQYVYNELNDLSDEYYGEISLESIEKAKAWLDRNK